MKCYMISFRVDLNNVVVPFLRINHLIQNKKAVNRPKDQIDIFYVEKIKKIFDEVARQKIKP